LPLIIPDSACIFRFCHCQMIAQADTLQQRQTDPADRLRSTRELAGSRGNFLVTAGDQVRYRASGPFDGVNPLSAW
jgi:hypothetical protein